MKNVFFNQEEAIMQINRILDKLPDQTIDRQLEIYSPWLLFTLLNTEYAINAYNILGVSLLNEVVPLLDTPAYCPGVIWDRGDMIYLLDLRALFGQGDYLSAIDVANDELPIIIFIYAGGRKCGMIVDEITRLEYSDIRTKELADRNSIQSQYINETTESDRFNTPVYVIEPDNFREMVFRQQNAAIDWKRRIDVRHVIALRRQKGSV